MLIYLNLILILTLCIGSLNSELIWDLENEAVVIQGKLICLIAHVLNLIDQVQI